jgi:hypothetical protein
MSETCGSCRFGLAIKENLLQVSCHGAPPQIVVVPAPGGYGISLQYPNLERATPACGLWQAKPPAIIAP